MSGSRKQEVNPVAAIGSVPLPSSDLIQYRFDQIDAKLEKFDQKLDLISTAYVPRAEIEERLSAMNRKLNGLKETDDRQQGAIENNRRVVAIGLTLLSIFTVAFTTYLGLHK